MIHQSVARAEKLRLIEENLTKRIDTLIVGPIGIGKSHLLAQLDAEHALKVQTLSLIKEALINIAEELHKHGKLYPHNEDFEKIKKTYEKHFWKFDRIEIEHLTIPEAKKLIRQCAAGADIEDYHMTETCILQQSAGNPRAIIEIVERLRKEPAVTRSAVRHVSHTGARNQIDLTFVVVLLLLAVVAARFFMRGIGSMEGYVLAGIGSAILVGIRFFMYRFKR